VGITRAKDRLYLIRCLRRGGRGYAEETYASRFLDDIPPELLNGKTRAGRRTETISSTHSWRTLSTPEPAGLKRAMYSAGMRVRHPMWGEGIVLNSRLQDGDETVDVVFESVGIKRLAASLANLTILH